MTIQPISDDDIILWPDGMHCERRELEQFGHRSDDYIVLAVDTPDWVNFLASIDAQ